MTNPHASGESQWTVSEGMHQPAPQETFAQSLVTPALPTNMSANITYEHWGVFKGDWRGFPVLAFNVSVSDVGGPIPDMDSHTLAVELPVLVPLLSITPATTLGSVRRLFRLGGPRFGHDGFDRRFQVDTSDKDFARRVLGPATTSWLLEHPVAAANPFRFEGSLLLMSNSGFMGPHETVVPKLEFLCELCTRVPSDCWASDT